MYHDEQDEQDEQDELLVRVRTLEAELEAERKLRQAAEAGVRASRAAHGAAALAAPRSAEEAVSPASTPLWRRGAVVVALLGSTLILGAGLEVARRLREREHDRAARYLDQLGQAEARLRWAVAELDQERKLREAAVAQLRAQAAASAPAAPEPARTLRQAAVARLRAQASASAPVAPEPAMTGSGTLDRGAVQRVIQQQMSAVQACHERAVLARPGVAGRVIVDFVIVPGGRVESARVTESTLADPGVNGCLLRVVRAWVFPAPAGGSVSVRYPFVFPVR